ncbi:hypothetical protein GGR57DRAFT_34955 [Xylariaceae sp. FL1272]|nr:hypothetical protein GGR57DRAFT_34955 [Xylariaceae sp. FL1272]
MSDALWHSLRQLLWWKGRGTGLRLQCPWSNCFPHLFTDDTSPCSTTAFSTFRRLSEHVRKYHAPLCKACSQAHPNNQHCKKKKKPSKRQKRDSSTEDDEVFEPLKDLHTKHRQNVNTYKSQFISKSSQWLQTTHAGPRLSKTMTPEQTEQFTLWKSDGYSDHRYYDPKVEEIYQDLCRKLFGDGIQVKNPQYHHLVLEYTANPESRKQGEMNLEYIQRRELDQHPETKPMQDLGTSYPELTETPGFTSHIPTTLCDHPQLITSDLSGHPMPTILDLPNPLSLNEDEGRQPASWSVSVLIPTDDSGYGSLETPKRTCDDRDETPLPPVDTQYIDPNLLLRDARPSYHSECHYPLEIDDF